MKIVTWNVNGIRARQAQLAELVAAEQPDVMCLQEIKAASDKVPELVVAASDYYCYWHGAGGYSGVALLVRHSFFTERPAFTHPSFDHEERIVVADVGALRIASVYVPNGGKDYPAKLAFMKSLAAWARRVHEEGRELVLCGDINIARSDMDVHPRERKPGIIGQSPEERELFEALLAAGLTDVGRTLDPENAGLFTWWPPWRDMRRRNIGWRLDYVLASKPLAARAQSCTVLADFGTSDHAPVVMAL